MQTRYEELRSQFARPAAVFRPMMFWIWNGDLDAGRIERQVADMGRHGCGGFFIHPMGENFRLADFVRGIWPPYLSDGYFEAVRWAVEAARRHGLYAWLYDEGGWPSGSAQGHVLEGHAEHTARVLRCRRARAQKGQWIEMPTDVVAVLAVSPDRPPEPVAVVDGWCECPGDAGVLILTAEPVAGQVDLLSPSAVRRFLDVTHEQYARWVGEHFGTTIPGIFTDEPAVVGRVGSEAIPWTAGMLELFRQRRGRDLEPLLPLLFAEQVAGEDVHKLFAARVTAQVRCEYCELWTDLYHEAYWQQINDWCEAHGLIHTGHVGGEDTLLEHGRHGFGHFFKTAGSLHAPGVDAIWRQLCWDRENFGYPQFASSAAHQRARRVDPSRAAGGLGELVVTETNGVYGLGLTYEQMRWLVDYQAIRGVNLIAPMAYSYETGGGRLFRTQDEIGPAHPLWAVYGAFADYVGRLCVLLRAGVPLADVAVYYPIEAVWPDPDGPVAHRAWASLQAITRTLHEEQVAFDFIDSTALIAAAVNEGVLETPGQFYGTVVVPETPLLPVGVMEKLVALYEAGGRVVFATAVPEFPSEHGRDEAYSRLVDRILDQAVVMDLEAESVLGGDTMAGVAEVARWDGMAAAVGMPPRLVDQFPEHLQRDQAVLIAPEDEIGRLGRLLALRTGRYGIQPAGVVPELRLYVRDLDPLLMAFAMNESGQDLECELDLIAEVPSVLERWDALEGTVEQVALHEEVSELTRVPLRLAAGESALLVLRPREDGEEVPAMRTREGVLPPVIIDQLDTPDAVWVVAQHQIVDGDVHVVEGSGVGAALPARLGPWEELGLTDFSGAVAYEFSFPLAAEYVGQQVILDLGEVCYTAQVRVNDQELRPLLWAPYRVEVGEYLREHGNRLTVVVRNTLANQACAADVVARARQSGWFSGYYERALPMMAETLRSGLMGPVRLII